MRILILSCSTGDGHNSAARALLEAAGRKNAEAELRDPVAFGGKRASRAVAGVYNGMIRHAPRLFGAVYRIGSVWSGSGVTSPVYGANSLYAGRLAEYIAQSGTDAVISTHLYGLEAMTAARRRGETSVPHYGVLTDYTFVPFFNAKETDPAAVFIPHADLITEGEERGFGREAILATGIPVSARFGEEISREEARARLGLPERGRIYLLMSGGVGCSNMKQLSAALAPRIGEEDRILVVTGRNGRMKAQLEEQWKDLPSVIPLGFTRDVALYMKAADVTVSKAGGLSSTEAAVAGVPLVHMMTIPGCETENAVFFGARGMSLRADTVEEAADAAVNLASDEAGAERMRRAQRENTHADAADRVIDYVLAHGN